MTIKKFERQLIARLYRFQCPPVHVITGLVEQTPVQAAHIANCPLCRHDRDDQQAFAASERSNPVDYQMDIKR